jgi:hypothetical protein
MTRTSEASFRIVVAVMAGLVVVRSIAFVVFEQLHFDADQAVLGLMALHLSEGRAFPLYTYGQGYILAVSVWFTAPFIWLLGPTVAALKLPLLGFNLAVITLLLYGLVRDARLSPWAAAVVSLPFALPPVIPAGRLLEHIGGNIEPFLWVLLFWVLRGRPLALGLLAAIALRNREFSAYGLVALAVVMVMERRYRERGWWRNCLLAIGAAAFGLGVIAALKPYSTYPSDFVPGFGFGGWNAALARARNLVDIFLPALAGAPGQAFGQKPTFGHAAAPVLLSGACLAALLVIWKGRQESQDHRGSFPVFLVVTGGTAMLTYVALGRGSGSGAFLRYVLLALLFPVGLMAAALARRVSWPRHVAAASLILWGILSAADHARLLTGCLSSPPPCDFRELAAYLEGRGIETGLADYWTAYPVDYLSGERVRLAGTGLRRIHAYRLYLEAHKDLGVAIVSTSRCKGGTRVARWCVLGPPAPSHLRESVAQATSP